jgi:GMC oxidoreductase
MLAAHHHARGQAFAAPGDTRAAGARIGRSCCPPPDASEFPSGQRRFAEADLRPQGSAPHHRDAGARAVFRQRTQPQSNVSTDADLEAFIRANVATTYHPVGTCKMGLARDAMAVVDSRLRVHGVTGLRVADASIMPNIIGGNTSAPSMMIGERAANFILEDSAGSAKADREALSQSGPAYA